MPSLNPVPGTFIFRPGATTTRFDAGVPVYSDFLELYSDLQATEGRKVIIFDDSISSPCTIPVLSGSYLFGDTKWSAGGFSLGSDNGVDVTFAVGAVFATPPVAFEGVEVTLPAGVATPFVYSSSNQRVPMRNCRFNTTSGGPSIPIFSVTGTGTTFQLDDTRFSAGGLVPVVIVTGNITFVIESRGDSAVSSSSIITPNPSIFVETYSGTGSSVATQGGVLGTSLTTLNNDAAYLKYVPTTPGDWSTVPGDVEAALDFVAAAAESGDGGTVYVSKAGSNSNSGLSPTRAKLTISAAETVAAAFAFPAVVRVLDGGTYSESVTLSSSVSLDAPYASISTAGTALVLGSGSSVRVHNVTSTAGGAVEASGSNHIDIDEVDVSGSAVAVKLSGTGIQYVDIRQVNFSSGVGVEFTYTSFGQVYANFGRVSGGTGTCIQQISGDVGGSVYCTAKRLQGSGTGILISGGTTTGDYQVSAVQQTVAFNAAATSTINVVAARVVGSTTGAGTVNVVKAV